MRMRFLRVLSLFFFLMLAPVLVARPLPGPAAVASATGPGPGTTGDSSHELDTHYVPVLSILYGTDRVPSREGKRTVYGSRKSPEVHYGVCRVVFDPAYRRRSQPGARWMECVPRGEAKGPRVSAQPLSPAEFGERLGGAADSTFLFVHGFNNSFKDAALQAAQIAYDLQLQGPPVMYSWPSQGSLFQYVGDRQTVDEREVVGHLADFLERTVLDSRARKVDLVAHSMGTLLLCEALQRIVGGKSPGRDRFVSKVGSVVLLAADICRQTFEDRYYSSLEPYFKGRMVLYVSSKDHALQASSMFNHCARTGQGGSRVIVLPGLTTIDASPIAVGWGIGHDLGSHDGVIDDMYLSLNRGLSPAGRLLTLRDKDGLPYYELFDGVHEIKKVTDFNWALSGQAGLSTDEFTNLFHAQTLLLDGILEPGLGIRKGFLPSELDLRVNLSNGPWRPYLDAGLNYDEAGGGTGRVTAWSLRYGLGVEWIFNSSWGLGVGLNRFAELGHSGDTAAQPTLDALLGNKDFPWGGLYLQLSKYFDLEI